MILSVEVGFDLVCPWCLIGKRLLDRALVAFTRRHPGVVVEQHWRSVQLLPQMPAEGLPYQAFYLLRLGGAEAMAARQAQVRDAGRLAGVEFDFSRMHVMPNTAAAHALVNDARTQLGEAGALAMIDALFQAYFHCGVDIGDREALADIATEQGVRPGSEMPPPLTLQQGAVPRFVFNGRQMLSGAQPTDRLLEAMEASMRLN